MDWGMCIGGWVEGPGHCELPPSLPGWALLLGHAPPELHLSGKLSCLCPTGALIQPVTSAPAAALTHPLVLELLLKDHWEWLWL